MPSASSLGLLACPSQCLGCFSSSAIVSDSLLPRHSLLSPSFLSSNYSRTYATPSPSSPRAFLGPQTRPRSSPYHAYTNSHPVFLCFQRQRPPASATHLSDPTPQTHSWSYQHVRVLSRSSNTPDLGARGTKQLGTKACGQRNNPRVARTVRQHLVCLQPLHTSDSWDAHDRIAMGQPCTPRDSRLATSPCASYPSVQTPGVCMEADCLIQKAPSTLAWRITPWPEQLPTLHICTLELS